MKNYIVKINSLDNVAIAVEDLPSGTIINEELTAIEEIPQAHKIALADIPKGGEIRRYNTIIGYAKEDIKKVVGSINTWLTSPQPQLLMTWSLQQIL